MNRTMSEIGKAIDNEAIEARKAYIIDYLNKMGITHHAGRDLEDMAVRELEPIYIKEKNKEGSRCKMRRSEGI